MTRIDATHPAAAPAPRRAARTERCMVATSQQLAARAGVDFLEAGGSAADAAVSAAALLDVVGPPATGIGGDACALIRPELLTRGHEIEALGRMEAGGAQLVLRADEGLHGASDPRKDGRAVGR